VNIPPHKTGPFSTRQIYSYDAPTTHRRLAVITLLNESYRESIELTPAWLGGKLGLEPAVVAEEFAAFAAAHGVRDGRFDYGQLRISLHPGQRDDGTDTWYVCEFPTWP